MQNLHYKMQDQEFSFIQSITCLYIYKTLLHLNLIADLHLYRISNLKYIFFIKKDKFFENFKIKNYIFLYFKLNIYSNYNKIN